MTEFHCITQCYFRREHEAKRYLFHVSSHRRTCDRIRAVKVDKCLSASAPRRLIDPSRTCFHLRGLPAHASRSALLLVRRLYFVCCVGSHALRAASRHSALLHHFLPGVAGATARRCHSCETTRHSASAPSSSAISAAQQQQQRIKTFSAEN